MAVSIDHQESKENNRIKPQSKNGISLDIIKKVLNDPTARFLLGSSAGSGLTSSAVWLLNYLLTNKNCFKIQERILVLSKENGLKKLKKQNKIWGKYTRGDIVEKYYVPDLMQFEYALC